MGLESSINKLLATLYAAPMRPELWDVFVHDLSTLIAVQKAALIAHDLDEENHSICATVGDEVKASVNSYEMHYCQFDQWTLQFPKRTGMGRVVLGEEVWPENSMLRSVFYNEFLKEFGTRQMACLAVAAGPQAFDALSIFRGPSEDAFDSRQLALLRMLGPHLQSALAMRRKLSALETRVADLENALHRMASGLVLLDNRGRCVLVNQAAQAILDKRDGVYLERSVLCANGPLASQLRALIAIAIATAEGKDTRCSGGMLIPRANRKPLQILVVPFRPDAMLGSAKTAAIAILTDPESHPVLPAEILRALFGLTMAESRLALAMADGKSISQAADLYQIGLETVRTQVKSIFQKTGTRRQAELMKLLLGIAFP